MVNKIKERGFLSRSYYILLSMVGILLGIFVTSFAQEEAVKDRLLVVREAKKYKQTSVAVEAYLTDDILEVTILARMYSTKPKVYNALIIGPALGRMSPQEKQTLHPKAEDAGDAFKTTDMEGLIMFGKRTKEEKLKGTLTRELVKFKIPRKKIIPNKRYQLWIKIESTQNPGQPESFRFDLKDLPRLISQ